MAAAYPVERGASDGHAGKGPALSEAGQGDARRPDLEQQGDGHEEEGRVDEQQPVARGRRPRPCGWARATVSAGRGEAAVAGAVRRARA